MKWLLNFYGTFALGIFLISWQVFCEILAHIYFHGLFKCFEIFLSWWLTLLRIKCFFHCRWKEWGLRFYLWTEERLIPTPVHWNAFEICFYLFGYFIGFNFLMSLILNQFFTLTFQIRWYKKRTMYLDSIIILALVHFQPFLL